MTEKLYLSVQFQLIMNEVKTFYLIALSRTSRDLIALTIRCFHAKKCGAEMSSGSYCIPEGFQATWTNTIGIY